MLEVKQMLLENPQHIENILNLLEFSKVKIYRDKITCGNRDYGSGNSVQIKLDEHIFCRDFKYDVSGDIISFLMKKRNLEFVDVINIIKSELQIENVMFTKSNNSIFGGIYKRIYKPNASYEYNILDKELLNNYDKIGNLRFLKSRISLETQRKFNIGFDGESQRISIPWHDMNGNLIGIVGRTNIDNTELAKYFPIIPFSKSRFVYGLIQNYEKIQDSKEVLIAESEKSPMQADTMEIREAVVSVGCKSISNEQAKQILSCAPSKIILCFDEDVKDEEYLIEQCNRIKEQNIFMNCKVGYILDKKNRYLKNSSNNSPFDLSKTNFSRLKRKCTFYV